MPVPPGDSELRFWKIIRSKPYMFKVKADLIYVPECVM